MSTFNGLGTFYSHARRAIVALRFGELSLKSQLLHSFEILYPIRFPCSTAIRRMRLLPVT